MFARTVERLQCPACRPSEGVLVLKATEGTFPEVRSGDLRCRRCKAAYPILAGVALLVQDVGAYLAEHVKGVAQLVKDEEIPKSYRRDYLAACEEIQVEHIEEDLEAERVVALYVMNHYLKAEQAAEGVRDPLLAALIREHWECGPFSRIVEWAEKAVQEREGGLGSVVELSCGVGGLYPKIARHCERYLGVDSSFTSVAIGRHLALGAPYGKKLRVPRDLLDGAVSVVPRIPVPPLGDGRADLVVGDLEAFPVRAGEADVAVAMNTIDMLPEPRLLPRLQKALLKKDGVAIQTGPYIWHDWVARGLRKGLPKDLKESAAAVERLYEAEGFKILGRQDHVPWLFFKHIRQLEVYSVHMLWGAR